MTAVGPTLDGASLIVTCASGGNVGGTLLLRLAAGLLLRLLRAVRVPVLAGVAVPAGPVDFIIERASLVSLLLPIAPAVRLRLRLLLALARRVVRLVLADGRRRHCKRVGRGLRGADQPIRAERLGRDGARARVFYGLGVVQDISDALDRDLDGQDAGVAPVPRRCCMTFSLNACYRPARVTADS